jgi:hypothetical protein
VFHPKGQVFFGSADEVHDPRLAAAIFDRAVLSLIFEQKPAVAHEKTLYEIFENVFAIAKGGTPGFAGAAVEV